MTTEAMTVGAPLISSVSAHEASFWDTLSSEWSKLISLRSTQIMLGAGLVLSLGTAAIASLAMGTTQAEWPKELHPATFSMVGNIFSLIIYSVFGVMVMAGEYSSGMIRLTLTATPRRGRVFLAKLVLVGLIVLVFGLVTTVGMFLVTQAILGAYDMPLTGLSDADTRGIVLGLGAAMPFFPILGFAIAAVLRNTAGAITTILGLLWLPQIFGEFLPTWWRENIVSLLPQSGMDSLTLGHIEESPNFSDPAIAVAIVAVWFIAVVSAAYIRFVRSDA